MCCRVGGREGSPEARRQRVREEVRCVHSEGENPDLHRLPPPYRDLGRVRQIADLT